MKTLLRGLGLGASVVVLASTTAFTATAAAPAADDQRDRVPAEITAAMQRDLGLTPAQTARLLAQQDKAYGLDKEIPPRLGADFAGSWFDAKSGKLVVAVTDARRVPEVQAAGAEARVVKYSMATLDGIKTELDGLAGVATDRTTRTTHAKPAENRAAVAGLTSWHVDQITNSVAVTVLKGQRRAAALDTMSKHGDALRIEETDTAPSTAMDYMDGGDQFDVIIDGRNYGGCSAGFNVRNEADHASYLITAGHCGTRGYPISGRNEEYFGTFSESWFPGYDDALVWNAAPWHWTQGPWVDNDPSNGPVHIVKGWRNSGVGAAICKSGRTTRLTCGVITAKDESVNVGDGRIVNSLTRHSACVERGDSGGANFSGWGSNTYAEGVTSAAVLVQDRCLDTLGSENVSWYYPIEISLSYYGMASKYGVSLWTG